MRAGASRNWAFQTSLQWNGPPCLSMERMKNPLRNPSFQMTRKTWQRTPMWSVMSSLFTCDTAALAPPCEEEGRRPLPLPPQSQTPQSPRTPPLRPPPPLFTPPPQLLSLLPLRLLLLLLLLRPPLLPPPQRLRLSQPLPLLLLRLRIV